MPVKEKWSAAGPTGLSFGLSSGKKREHQEPNDSQSLDLFICTTYPVCHRNEKANCSDDDNTEPISPVLAVT